MKSTNPFAVHFIARPIKATPAEALLYVRISIARKRLEISLKKESHLNIGMQEVVASKATRN